MNGNFVPVSNCAGIGWPALPTGGNSHVLSLLYQLQQTQWWPPEELLRHQLLQLEVLAAHAYETVPFYRDRLAAVHGLGEGGLTYDAWRQIPFMRREDLQDSLNQIISTSCPKEHGEILLATSSGSTGKPVTVHGTSLTHLFFMALNQRSHIWFDSDLAGKFCVLEAMVRRAERKVDTWAAGYQSGPWRAFEITRPVAEQFAWLRDEAPEYLLTYPSNLQALVDHSNERGERVPNLRRVWTMSELLADIPHIPSKFVEIVPLSHRQGNCIPYAAIRWHDFGNRPALGRPLGHFSRHPDTPLLSLSPRRRFPRPTPERVFVADHQSSSGFSGTGPSAPPPQPIGT